MDEDIRTIWCGNLSEKVTEEILYELFMQAGPLQKVSIPKDRDGKQKNFGFVTYKHEESIPYALDLFDGTALYNRTLNLKSRNNTYENSHYNQQQQQQMVQQQQSADYGNAQLNLHQLGQQILVGAIAPLAFAQKNMFMMPGSLSYPSQNNSYSQNPQNSRDSGFSKNNSNNSNVRHNNRNHPYRGDNNHYNDRHDKRQDSYNNRSNRDQKSHKHSSSHRSNRHDNKRKYR